MRRLGGVALAMLLSPSLTRLAQQAAGLICASQSPWSPEKGEVDEYWEEWVKDIDGYGTDIDSFAGQVVYHSLFLGTTRFMLTTPRPSQRRPSRRAQPWPASVLD